MRNLSSFIIVLATSVAWVQSNGYSYSYYSRNPYSGNCQLQLVPGGGWGWSGQKYYYAYPGTRYGYYTYGSNYGGSQQSATAGTNYYGEASNQNHPIKAHVIHAAGQYDLYGKNSSSGGESGWGQDYDSSAYYGTGSYGHGGSYGSSYDGGSSASSSGSNYHKTSSKAASHHPVGVNHHSTSVAHHPVGAVYQPGYHQGAAVNKLHGSNNHHSSSSSSHGTSLNKAVGSSIGHGSDRNHGSSIFTTTRLSSHGGTKHRNPSKNIYDSVSSTGSKKYGGSSSEYDRNRDRDYDRDIPSSGYFDRDRDNDGYSKQSSYESSSSSSGSKYGSSSSGNRGGSSAERLRPSYNRESSYNSQSSSSGNRGSGGGGGSSSSGFSSSENYGGNRNYYNAEDTEYSRKEFASAVLRSHNAYRSKHTTPPVQLDDQMSTKAQAWAYDLASGRVPYGHSPEAVEGIYGESLQIPDSPSATGRTVVDKWYDERYNYNFRRPELVKSPRSKSTSHFTAIVWKSTRKIGVGKATSKDGRKTFVVVNYFPAGNIVDVLEDNVLPRREE